MSKCTRYIIIKIHVHVYIIEKRYMYIVYIIEKYFSNFTKLIFKRYSYNLYYLLFQILKIFKHFKPGIHDTSFATKSPFKFLEFKFFDRVYHTRNLNQKT